MSKAGIKLELPLVGSGEATCPETGEQYRLNGKSIEAIGEATK